MSRVNPGPGARKCEARHPDGFTDREHAAARTIKRVYTEERRRQILRFTQVAEDWQPSPRWDGSDGRGGPEGEPPRVSDYLKVARGLLSRGLDPAQYVRAQFSVFREHVLRPNQLLSPACLRNYEKAIDEAQAVLPAALTSQRALASGRIVLMTSPPLSLSRTEAWLYVALDTDLALSGLFRYCLLRHTLDNELREAAASVRDRFEEAATWWLPEAAAQYWRNPSAYDRHWGRILPPDFREFSRGVCIHTMMEAREGDDGEEA